MSRLLQQIMLITALLFSAMQVVAAPGIDSMSDAEVSEYAIQMSELIDEIRYSDRCMPRDRYCMRAEFARNGLSYDDKERVKKRLVIMIGTMH